MRSGQHMRNVFIAAWAALLLVKCALAAHLPLFVDEAFYWQEGQHPAWAYSDLPGLTAWLTRIGVEAGGHAALALRAPFLAIAAALPWLVAVIAARESGPRAGWVAALFALLLPLAGTLGLLALPDAAMAFATLLCMDAMARMFRAVDSTATVELALGLAIGALSHYRFIAVIGAGLLALLLLPEGRKVLRDARAWVAIAFGAAAWTPLIAWNMENAEAGLRFQLVERHPWAFHADGLWFALVQTLLVTPLLLLALALAAWRGARDVRPGPRLFAYSGALLVLGFFGLGFFADTERVSFHWPLPGYLALLPLLPDLLRTWPRWTRRATAALAATGLLAVLAYYAAVSIPDVRARSAAEKWYPDNFAGWDALAGAVRGERARMPPGTRIVADNFKIGAELGFALGDADIPVLDHPLNRKHGRAPQLRLWGLDAATRADGSHAPILLVVGASDVPYRTLLARYHALCGIVGPLPAPRVVNVDHGRQRFMLFSMPRAAPSPAAGCTAPAMAWIDTPASGATVPATFDMQGWAFKDGIGLSGVDVLIDGKDVARARYGTPQPGVAIFWKISNDPNHPRVGFGARIDASALPRGRHWLGLRLHGSDGSVETWSEQPIDVR